AWFAQSSKHSTRASQPTVASHSSAAAAQLASAQATQASLSMPLVPPLPVDLGSTHLSSEHASPALHVPLGKQAQPSSPCSQSSLPPPALKQLTARKSTKPEPNSSKRSLVFMRAFPNPPRRQPAYQEVARDGMHSFGME